MDRFISFIVLNSVLVPILQEAMIGVVISGAACIMSLNRRRAWRIADDDDVVGKDFRIGIGPAPDRPQVVERRHLLAADAAEHDHVAEPREFGGAASRRATARISVIRPTTG